MQAVWDHNLENVLEAQIIILSIIKGLVILHDYLKLFCLVMKPRSFFRWLSSFTCFCQLSVFLSQSQLLRASSQPYGLCTYCSVWVILSGGKAVIFWAFLFIFINVLYWSQCVSNFFEKPCFKNWNLKEVQF